MSRAKTELFESDLAAIASFSKALSHPVRIQILRILAEKDVCMCGEIVDLVPLAQSTVSQHLKELKKARLIKGEVDGPKTCYCLDKKALGKALASFSRAFSPICRCRIKGDKK
jgi:ArsR family transcriptional regulator, arsenate/arsenite/antimonite-responsive transcriptional repressor